MKDAKTEKRRLVTSIDALCGFLECTRPTFYEIKKRFGAFPDWPKLVARKYDVLAFQEFWSRHGIKTASQRLAEANESTSLNDELKRRDLILRDLAISEKRKALIDRAAHENDMLLLAGIFSTGLQLLEERFQSMGLSPHHMDQARTHISDTRSTIERQISQTKFDEPPESDQ